MPNRNRFLLDSGIVMRVLRRDFRAADLVDYLSQKGTLVTSAIVAFEIYRGCRNPDDETAAREFFQVYRPLPVGEDAALGASRLFRSQSGVFSGEKSIPDALIAATAVVDGAALVTLNTRQFSRVQAPGLELLLVDQDSRDWVAAVS